MMVLLVLWLCVLAAVPTTSFQLVAGLPHQNADVLETKFWQIATPSSPDYLKFLTLNDVKNLVGASPDTVATVSTWFRKIGAEAVAVSPLRDTVTATFHPTTTFPSNPSNNKFPAHNFTLDYLIRRDPTSKDNAFATPNKKVNAGAGAGGGTYSIPNQKKAYGIPDTLMATNDSTLQMVWGPGTFGFSMSQLEDLKQSEVPLLNTTRVNFDTANHGQAGGDNYGEGNLDTQMISSFGLNVHTLVSNTNTSSSTEEGKGFGQALLDFVTTLSSRKQLPQVLSLSLGSLNAYSCQLLCDKAVAKGISMADCNQYLQQQRQVCMFLSIDQVNRISSHFKILGARGVTIFGSSGDGGSHFSFQPFEGGNVASVLNDISCAYAIPVFPTSSPYVVSVGGTDWSGFFKPDPTKPKAWSGSGGGFSWQFPQPSHQQQVVSQYLSLHAKDAGFPSPGSFNATGRAYPDIAAVAVDGTSQSSPTVAGIFSLLMDHRLNAGLPPLGFVAPRLWSVNSQHPGEAFESVTSGNTKTSCDTGFPASNTGWDAVTGWGRPVWAGIVKHFGSDANL